MFEKVAITVLIATPTALLLHLAVMLGLRRTPRLAARPFGFMEKLIYAALILSIAVLAATSLYSVLRHGVMSGWMLWAHLSAAGLFVVALAAAAVVWAEASRLAYRPDSPHDPILPRFMTMSRAAFWVVLAAGLISLGSMLAGMLKWVGTEGQHQLLIVHRYAGLVVAAAAAVHAYGLSLGRRALK